MQLILFRSRMQDCLLQCPEPGQRSSRDRWIFFDALTLRKMFDGCGNGCKTGAAAGKIREGEIK
jgi:hypothetical protein